MESISDARNEHDEWWGVHHPIEGDLVGMSYLYYIKKFYKTEKYKFDKPELKCRSNINLYNWGDSYTAFMPDSAFASTGYKFGRRYWHHLYYHLDTAQRNVLMIEIAERYVLEYFGSTNIYLFVYDSVKKNNSSASLYNTSYPKVNYAAFQFPISLEDIYNPRINQNIEYNVFNYNFLNAIKKTKAWFNYTAFERASGDVKLSDNGDYLLLKETVGNDKFRSSYVKLSEKDITKAIIVLNAIYKHYKDDGFDEVYLSIIPNPATILQNKNYNNLIPLLQNDSRLQMKVIDVYDTFRHSKLALYWRGDSHWNNAGVKLWLNEVNKMIKKECYNASL